MNNYNLILIITIVVSLFAIYLLVKVTYIIYQIIKLKKQKKNKLEINFELTEYMNDLSPSVDKKNQKIPKEKLSSQINFEFNGF